MRKGFSTDLQCLRIYKIYDNSIYPRLIDLKDCYQLTLMNKYLTLYGILLKCDRYLNVLKIFV